jgi:hypothetical protein
VFDHRNFATHGLFPGLVTTSSIANLGHWSVEVIIEPVVPTGGGGGFYTPLKPDITKYRVRIRITRKGKVWEYDKVVNLATAKVVAKVIGKTIQSPSITVGKTSMVEQVDPVIKVTIK